MYEAIWFSLGGITCLFAVIVWELVTSPEWSRAKARYLRERERQRRRNRMR